MSFSTTQRRDRFGLHPRRFLRTFSALLWCLVLLWTPATAQVSIEDSEIPVEENEERESKESTESSDLLAFRSRRRQLSPRPVALWATTSLLERSLNRLASPRSGHSLHNGLLAPMTC
ncbi:MAG: hypothetical protein VX311_04340 [Planctomycetota bacterium]|nr:hypothetical protein [Planctomycetota bacterium]